MKTGRPPQGGFSLLELLVVIAIVMLLAGLSIGALLAGMGRGRAERTNLMFQQLAASLKAMKAAYQRSGPLGVDDNGNPLPKAQLDQLDLGWELDPRNGLWGPGGVPAATLLFNKKRHTFYNTTKDQVSAGPEVHLVDYFGNRLRYELVENGGIRIERILSFGQDGVKDTQDDIEIVVGRYPVP